MPVAEVPVGDDPGQRPESVQAVARPGRAIDDEPVGHLEELDRLAGGERRVARPPQHHRQVVDEEWRHDRREVAAALPAGREGDELGARFRRVGPGQDAMGLDLGVQPGRAVGVGAGDDEGPRRVAPGEHLDHRRGVLPDLRPAGDDHEIHHARPGRDVALRLAALALGRERRLGPDAVQLGLDTVDGVGSRRPAQDGLPDRRGGVERAGRTRRGHAVHPQIRRQRRPSRSMSASAVSGPQVPAG